MKELLTKRGLGVIACIALGTSALEACTVDSYLTDPSNVKCDGNRTEVDLKSGGLTSFIVHGKQKGQIATVQVRHSQNNEASLRVANDTANSPPQQYAADGFSAPTPIVNGSELSVVAGGGAWIIDVRKSTVVIEGSCAG